MEGLSPTVPALPDETTPTQPPVRADGGRAEERAAERVPGAPLVPDCS